MKIYHCADPEENPLPYWMKKREIELDDYDDDQEIYNGYENETYFPAFISPKLNP